MLKDSSILIVGHNDSIDNSLRRYFVNKGYTKVFSSAHDKLNVLDAVALKSAFQRHRFEYVFLGSIRSGGIVANQKHPAEFIYENCQAQNNVIHLSWQNGVKKLLYFTGSCAYPKEAKQPIKEHSLLTGPLEETSLPYSVAKIAGTTMCQAYRAQYGFNAIVAVPATLYGPGSDTDLETAHVMGALIGKFAKAIKDDAKEVVVWGSGKAKREFLYVDDFVSACVFLMKKYNSHELINIGTGSDISIKDLAMTIKRISGFQGNLVFDRTKPDGTLRKLMDNRRLVNLGWKAKVGLEKGIEKTYSDYKKEGRT